jgi:riboflavin biosynthesis pyrimidine reductase
MGKGKSLDLGKAIDELRSRGLKVLLTEGGPHLMGQLIDQGLLDEAFLTISPVIAGRKEERRLGMVEGVELLPKRGLWSSLLSARRHGDYLFLRYRLPTATRS